MITSALLLAGFLLGMSWFMPLSIIGAILCPIAFITLLLTVQHIERKGARGYYWSILLGGMLAHTFGFYWIYGTIANFGHFPPLAALGIFLLFITLSSLQFPLFLLVRRLLPRALDRLALRSPCAWIAIEVLAIRIFPWSASQPLAASPMLVQAAEFGGVLLTSFLLVWLCETIATALLKDQWRFALCAIGSWLVLGAWGHYRIEQVRASTVKEVPVTLVQGAIPLSEKHNQALVKQNVSEYLNLSREADKPGQLIVWPETVLMDWIPENVGNASLDHRMPVMSGGSSLIFGALSFSARKEMFNSAFAIGPDGSVPLPYHKRILMPFGEFTPFGDTFPVLRTLNSTAGDFSEGTGTPLMTVPLKGAGENDPISQLKVTPLICYEDVLPYIATEGTVAGAELLVNLTNDAWFGESIAPIQHHQIALFRAIENRRSLIRATNTGLSAVVAPTGESVLRLPPFTRTALSGSAPISEINTIYNRFGIQTFWRWFALLCSGLSILRFLTISRAGTTA